MPHSKRIRWTAQRIPIQSQGVASNSPISDLHRVSPHHTPHKWENFISVFIRIISKRITQHPSAPKQHGPNKPFLSYVTDWIPMGAQEPKANAVPNRLVANKNFAK